jgi:hypothetical protein
MPNFLTSRRTSPVVFRGTRDSRTHGANLDEFLLEARQRPVCDRLGGAGGKEPRPSDRSCPARPTLVVEGDDIRGRPRHVG